MSFKSDDQRKAVMANYNQKDGNRKDYNVKPSLLTKSDVSSDIKRLMRQNRSVRDSRTNYKKYRRKLRHHADVKYNKELNKARKREKKQERLEEKQEAQDNMQDHIEDGDDKHIDDPNRDKDQ